MLQGAREKEDYGVVLRHGVVCLGQRNLTSCSCNMSKMEVMTKGLKKSYEVIPAMMLTLVDW